MVVSKAHTHTHTHTHTHARAHAHTHTPYPYPQVNRPDKVRAGNYVANFCGACAGLAAMPRVRWAPYLLQAWRETSFDFRDDAEGSGRGDDAVTAVDLRRGVVQLAAARAAQSRPCCDVFATVAEVASFEAADGRVQATLVDALPSVLPFLSSDRVTALVAELTSHLAATNPVVGVDGGGDDDPASLIAAFLNALSDALGSTGRELVLAPAVACVQALIATGVGGDPLFDASLYPSLSYLAEAIGGEALGPLLVSILEGERGMPPVAITRAGVVLGLAVSNGTIDGQMLRLVRTWLLSGAGSGAPAPMSTVAALMEPYAEAETTRARRGAVLDLIDALALCAPAVRLTVVHTLALFATWWLPSFGAVDPAAIDTADLGLAVELIGALAGACFEASNDVLNLVNHLTHVRDVVGGGDAAFATLLAGLARTDAVARSRAWKPLAPLAATT